MKKNTMSTDEITYSNIGKKPANLTRYNIKGEIAPIHYWIREDGAIDNTPSLGIVLSDAIGETVVAQMSFNTLNKALAEAGYTIRKLKKIKQ